MNLFQKEKCKNILGEIKKHPLSVIFNYPIDPVEEGIPNYFTVVKTPMDLSTIQANLDNNKYQTIADWKSDMTLVWSNAVKYFTKKSYIGVVAIELEKYFNKLCENNLVFTNQQWMDLITKKYKKINNNIDNVKFKTVFANIKSNKSRDDKNQNKINELPSSFTDKGDVLKVLQILNFSGIKTDLQSEEISIPVSKLSYKAKNYICDYTKNSNKLNNIK